MKLKELMVFLAATVIAVATITVIAGATVIDVFFYSNIFG
jgi:hypothetical protein